MKLIFIVFLALIESITCCSKYFQYFRDEHGEIFGLLKVHSDIVEEIKVEIQLSVAARLNDKKNVGKITLINSDVYGDLKANRELEYKVSLAITEPLPILTLLKLNGKQLCSDAPARGSYVTTITLFYTYNFYGLEYYENNHQQQLKTTSTTYRPIYHKPNVINRVEVTTKTTTKRPVQTTTKRAIPTTTTTTTMKTTSANVKTQPTQDNHQCGVRNKDKNGVTSLIIGGRKTMPNEFPWLAAFFYKNEFQCSGSLVSKNIVVFAAHCVENKGEITQKKPYDSRFELGKHDIENSNEPRSQSAGVENFIIHPNWKPHHSSYHGDISVAILNVNVQFTPFISPICMWQQTSDHDDLVNKKGVIAGWGITDDGYISRTPRHVSLPAVSDGVCLRSNTGFSTITSNSTFCVGDKKGSIPCKGDSGSGFAFQSNNKYYLRGIVSAAIVDDNDDCSIDDYVVFTDAAQYSTWIQRFIKAYD